MAFIPGHSCVVLFKVETGSVTESTDGVTPAALPAIPSSPTVLGYTDLPQWARGLNNSKGFAIGAQGAAYGKRGARQPSITINIRPGNVAALANLVPDANGVLPSICLYFVQKGQNTVVFRFCKPGSLNFNFSGGDGQDGEVTISAPFQAIAVQSAAAITVAESAVRALGTPLMWHDVRTFNVTDAAGTAASYRRALMSLSVEANYNLERKNVRANWGDNEPLSSTSYSLLEHHLNISGEIGLHERLPEALFTGAANAQDWGNIELWCSDDPLGLTESKGFTITLGKCFPSDENMQGGESSSEVNYSIPFTANTLTFALDA